MKLPAPAYRQAGKAGLARHASAGAAGGALAGQHRGLTFSRFPSSRHSLSGEGDGSEGTRKLESFGISGWDLFYFAVEP
ncbi:MAG: hypothetical protein ACE144_16945 [Thermodesulfobacteriota bacterium]